MAVAAMLRDLLFKTKRYLAAKEAGKDPNFDFKLESMIPVIKKEIPLKAHAHRADDILTAIRIAKEFGLKLTLDHCTEGALIADELAKEGFPALVGPSFGSKSKPELRFKSFDTPAKLHKAGVKVSIITDATVIPLEALSMCAGLAVNAGLDEEAAWHSITINPATAMGISDRVGSLEVGKDGDLVIWDRNPLYSIGNSAYMTVIEGKIVYKA
jgi:imidazolonepropionase-like amidohydrolase